MPAFEPSGRNKACLLRVGQKIENPFRLKGFATLNLNLLKLEEYQLQAK